MMTLAEFTRRLTGQSEASALSVKAFAGQQLEGQPGADIKEFRRQLFEGAAKREHFGNASVDQELLAGRINRIQAEQSLRRFMEARQSKPAAKRIPKSRQGRQYGKPQLAELQEFIGGTAAMRSVRQRVGEKKYRELLACCADGSCKCNL